MAINYRKAAVIGCGFVGASIAFRFLQQGLFSHLVLVDANQEKAEGEAMDLSDGLPYGAAMDITAGGYDDITDCGLVVITAGVNQTWATDPEGRILHWPVDRYFEPGERMPDFLGHCVPKQHHTLTQILMGLLRAGFCLEAVEEAQPPEELLDVPGMADELRRPMMLLVRCRRGGE